jgi:hypothetical protein
MKMEIQEAANGVVGIQVILFIGMLVFGLVALLFWSWMLVDCLMHETSEGNDKILWVLVIVLTNGIGALIYFFVRRPQRKREQPLF